MKSAEFQTKVLEDIGAIRIEVAAISTAVVANERARVEQTTAHELHDNERFAANSKEQAKTGEAVAELKKAIDAQIQAQVVSLAGELSDQKKTAAAQKHDWQKHAAMVAFGALLTWLLHAFHVL